MKKIVLALAMMSAVSAAKADSYYIDSSTSQWTMVAPGLITNTLHPFDDVYTLRMLETGTFKATIQEQARTYYEAFQVEEIPEELQAMAPGEIYVYRTTDMSYSLTDERGNEYSFINGQEINLQKGDYKLTVAGSFEGFSGGYYQIDTEIRYAPIGDGSTSPVPEPGTFAMMALGVISMLSIAYKRMKKDQA